MGAGAGCLRELRGSTTLAPAETGWVVSCSEHLNLRATIAAGEELTSVLDAMVAYYSVDVPGQTSTGTKHVSFDAAE